LRQLADLTGASTFHLLRLFKQEVGLPPAAYQIHLKVAAAKRLLRLGGSIADAAAELGFVDQSHLTRHFRKIVGTTPGRYAEQ
jgi:AraC-like DNA-binding protein